MAEKMGIYRCEKCGNVVQVLHGAQPPATCCGKPMDRLVANTVDAAKEKHVPVVEKNRRWIQSDCGQRCPSHDTRTLY